ncbi:VOC family protein [Butyricimonas hominis]|uniref:VOC family protein n=1 Tax=Butyricimonas hominis TaxID=2763032 RepID=UPI003512377A
MRYCCTVLSVSDINKARSFYENIFGLEVCQDYGRNILFSCGLALQQDFDRLIGVPQDKVYKKSNNVEIAFEERDFDGFLQKLNDNPGIVFLGEVIELDWGQRVIRFYDLDGHLIEVGEEMKMVIERFISDGMTLEEVSQRMDVAVDTLLKLLDSGHIVTNDKF